MAKPDGTKGVTMYVDGDLLDRVDEAACNLRGRRNDRTTWVSMAMEEKLERDGDSGGDPRRAEVTAAFDMAGEEGREWLAGAARLMGGHPLG